MTTEPQSNEQELDRTWALAEQAYNAIAEQLPGETVPFADLPESLRCSWFYTAVHTQIHADFPTIDQQPVIGSVGRCSWTVSAGVVPKHAIPDLSKQWVMTAQDYEDPSGSSLFSWRMFEAINHLTQLNAPDKLNWARLDWLWY
ncbi:MAG: hypothetical protein AAGF24_09090 [Cyanobacteria bacterium P01_H01_bin.121]